MIFSAFVIFVFERDDIGAMLSKLVSLYSDTLVWLTNKILYFTRKKDN